MRTLKSFLLVVVTLALFVPTLAFAGGHGGKKVHEMVIIEGGEYVRP